MQVGGSKDVFKKMIPDYNSNLQEQREPEMVCKKANIKNFINTHLLSFLLLDS